jgi:hypothetical protein
VLCTGDAWSNRDSYRSTYKDIRIPCHGFNRQGANVSEGMWRSSQAFKEPAGIGMGGGPAL